MVLSFLTSYGDGDSSHSRILQSKYPGPYNGSGCAEDQSRAEVQQDPAVLWTTERQQPPRKKTKQKSDTSLRSPLPLSTVHPDFGLLHVDPEALYTRTRYYQKQRIHDWIRKDGSSAAVADCD